MGIPIDKTAPRRVNTYVEQPFRHRQHDADARRADEDGQTMAEYGILIAVIALIVVVAAVVLGGSISGLFGSTAAQV